MRFANPLYLFFLFLIPIIVWIYLKKHKTVAISYPNIKIISKVFSPDRKRSKIILILRISILTLLMIAFARPQKGLITTESSTKGIDIILCIDTSTSMSALDFKPKNRLEVAKETAKEFIKARKNDRIGIVVFSGLSFTQCPLTIDYNALLEFLDKVEIGMTQIDGTAIGTALMTCISRLKDSPGKSKVIILLSDGRNNMGDIDPITAAKAAQSTDIKIYTIGMGAPGKALFPVQHPVFGLQYVYLPEELDEPTMKQIATITAGKYFRAKTYHELVNIYKQIDKLEKTEIKTTQFTEYKELYHFFVLPAFLLFLGEIIVTKTILRKIP